MIHKHTLATSGNRSMSRRMGDTPSHFVLLKTSRQLWKKLFIWYKINGQKIIQRFKSRVTSLVESISTIMHVYFSCLIISIQTSLFPALMAASRQLYPVVDTIVMSAPNRTSFRKLLLCLKNAANINGGFCKSEKVQIKVSDNLLTI